LLFLVDRAVVRWERVGTAIPRLFWCRNVFALVTLREDLDFHFNFYVLRLEQPYIPAYRYWFQIPV